MARTRSLNLSLLKRISKLELHTQSAILRLPVACDDAGRTTQDFKLLAHALFPGRTDIEARLSGWLDEMERAGFIERYVAGDLKLLRMIDWSEWQKVVNPTPSRLPPSPNEQPDLSKIIESSRKLQGREGKRQSDQSVVRGGSAFIESPVFPGERIIESEEAAVARKEALAALARIQDKAEGNDAHHAAIRAVIEQMRLRSLSMKLTVDRAANEMADEGDRAASGDSDEPVDASLIADRHTPSPAAAFGLPRADR